MQLRFNYSASSYFIQRKHKLILKNNKPEITRTNIKYMPQIMEAYNYIS